MRLLRKIMESMQLKKIKKWKSSYYEIDFNELEEDGYENVEIWIKPWVGTVKIDEYNLIKEEIPDSYKDIVIAYLFDIFNNWSLLLSNYHKPYFLGIIFYEGRLSTAQIVLAIEDKIDFYKSQFIEIEKSNEFTLVPELKSIISGYNWGVYQENSSNNNILIVKAPKSIW